MPRLIERFASTLGASQRANIETLLTEGSIDGEIKDYEAFKAKLEELAGSINLEATPLFNIALVFPGKLISSASYNQLVELAQLDIETIYTEVDNIFQLADQHRSIFDQKIQDIKDSLAKLDSRISTLELISGDPDYGLAQFNTFNGIGTNSLSKTDTNAATLYYDYRAGESLLASTNEAVVDISREGLILPIIATKQVVISNIALEEGSLTTESDLEVDPTNNALENVFSEDDGLYWVRSVLLLEEDAVGNKVSPPADGVIARIRLDLNGFQEINSIKLVPFTDNTFTIDSISYLDIDGGEFAILSTSTELADSATFTFSRVFTNTIFLDIRQKSYTELSDFYYSSAPEDLSEIQSLASTSGISDIDIGGGGGQLHAKGFLYTMGFDFIGASKASFDDKGIYVSEPISSTVQVTELVLDASVEHSQDGLGNPLDSFEFYIGKFNYDNSGLLVTAELFPVNHSSSITHEELILDVDTASTRFFPDYSTLKIYRDFGLLTLGTDFTLSVNGQDFRSDLTSLNGDVVSSFPQKLLVKFIDPRISSIYTTSYTPVTSVQGSFVYLNIDSTVQFNGDSIRFTYSPDTTIVRSDIYTVVILRTLDYTASRETGICFDYSTRVAEASSGS